MNALVTIIVALAPTVDAPIVGRPGEHFYGAIGEQVRVTMHASPTELRAEDPLIVTFVITGATNPEQIERPDLNQLPEFAQRFHIENLPEDAVPSGQRFFRYSLRPKNDRVREVPPLLFHYWNPRLNYFATTATREAIVLTVTARNPLSGTADAEVPAFLSEDPPELPAPVGGLWALVIAIFLPPLGFLVWWSAWRRLRPDAARRARLQRSRAVRVALDNLADLPAGLGFADGVAAVVRSYLAGRTGLPVHASAPDEIAAWMTSRGVAAHVAEGARALFEQLDAARFGPSAEHSALAEAARGFVLAAEDTP